MQTHQQLPYQIMACTRYHRHNRERNQQKTKNGEKIMKGRYTYDIQHRVIKKDENYLARLTDKEAHKITDELNRQDTIINKYERTISKIRKILRS